MSAPGGEDELREALLRVITREVQRGCGRVNRMAEDLAEDVLNDPAIAALLADRERHARYLEAQVQRVRELSEEFAGRAAQTNGWSITFRDKLRRALDGNAS